MDFEDTPEEAAFRAEARAWLDARGDPAVHTTRDGDEIHYRLFTSADGKAQRRAALVMNLTQEKLDVIVGCRVEALLSQETTYCRLCAHRKGVV